MGRLLSGKAILNLKRADPGFATKLEKEIAEANRRAYEIAPFKPKLPKRENRRWTPDEDSIVFMNKPIREIAAMLNRSYSAVALRRHALKKMGVSGRAGEDPATDTPITRSATNRALNRLTR